MVERIKTLRNKHHKVDKLKEQAFNIPEHSNESFGIALHKIMGATGHTQWTLSKALDVSNTTISNYLSEKRSIFSGGKIIREKMDMMRLIADELDIKPTYFLEYRMILLEEKIKLHPKLVDIFLELASQPKTLINSWEEQEPKFPRRSMEERKEAEQSDDYPALL